MIISSNEKHSQKLKEHSSAIGFLYDIHNMSTPANQPTFFLHDCKSLQWTLNTAMIDAEEHCLLFLRKFCTFFTDTVWQNISQIYQQTS